MMYYEMIGDRQVFSDCRTIQTNEGVHYVRLIDNNVWSPAELPSGREARP